MQLHFVSRTVFRDKNSLLNQLPLDLESIYILHEGGTNEFALKGCSEMVTSYEYSK